MIELIWMVRREVNTQHNNWTDFSGIDGRDPITQVVLKFNGGVRIQGRHAAYFRLVQPFQHHSKIPNGFIYCYSFALYPEDASPTGSTNLSRLNSAHLILTLQDGLQHEPVDIMVFARSWQIMRYIEGTGGPMFTV